MQLIPVMDLRQGQVVRAVRGERGTYQPVRSQLCPTAEPLAVAQALTRHCASPLLYVADLDALLGGAPHTAVLQLLLQALPDLQLWVDAGFADRAAAEQWLRSWPEALARRVTPVFASEALRDAAALRGLCQGDAAAAQRCVLSLDRRQGQRMDLAGCWDMPEAWPQRVIVMTLERVGAGAGPDLQTLADVQRSAPAAQLIGAGGIRHLADLRAAEAAGAWAWLVASALHDGAIAPVA
jgi:uncharacterized protein related to proFAR isomerase